MKKQAHNQGAAVLIFAVLLLAAGVFVLTGIAQLAATQAVVGGEEWRILDRRIMLENSRAMARQFLLTRMFRSAVSNSVGYTNPALGGFSLSPISGTGLSGDYYWTTPSAAAMTTNLKINPFTLLERGGFYRTRVPGKLLDEVSSAMTNEVDWNFQVRTRSPVAAGYSFVQQLPASNNLSGLVPSGVPYIDMQAADKFIGFPLMPRMPVSSVTNTNPDPNGYTGYLGIPLVPGGSSYGQFTNYRLEPRGTNLQLVLDLLADDPTDTNSVVLFEMTNDKENSTNIEAVVLVGADTPTAKPLHVVIGPAISNVTLLVLSNNNERLVYLNRQKQTNDGAQFDIVSDPDASSWRLGMTVSHSPVQFEIGTLEIIGGLRTDGAITFQGGEAYFIPEGSPEGLDYIADRMMWLEDYKTP
jgi:hypothetical protein